MFWNYMVQSAFDTVWSIKGLWWIFKLFCMSAYSALCVFVSVYFMQTLGFWAYILLALISADYLIFWARLSLACYGGADTPKTMQNIANASGALLIIKMVLRVLNVCTLFVCTVLLVELAVTPVALCIILLVVACLLCAMVISKELGYTFYKFVKYKAKKELEYMYAEAEQLMNEERQHIEEKYFQ